MRTIKAEEIEAFQEGVRVGKESITGCPPIEDREAFRALRRRVTLSGVDFADISSEDEQALHRAIQEARDVGEAVLDRVIAEYLNDPEA